MQGYELDSFNHVNNAVYLNYFEAARWKFFREVNILDYMMENKVYPVVVSADLRYMRELKLFERFMIKSKWFVDGNFVIAKQTISSMDDKAKITKAVIKMLLVSEQRIVYDIPKKLKMCIEKG